MNIRLGAVYQLEIAPGIIYIAKVMEYAPHLDYVECKFGEVQGDNAKGYAVLDHYGVFSISAFENAKLISEPPDASTAIFGQPIIYTPFTGFLRVLSY